MSVATWCCTCFCVVLCVSFRTGHFVMVPLNLTLNCIYIVYSILYLSICSIYIVAVMVKQQMTQCLKNVHPFRSEVEFLCVRIFMRLIRRRTSYWMVIVTNWIKLFNIEPFEALIKVYFSLTIPSYYIILSIIYQYLSINLDS